MSTYMKTILVVDDSTVNLKFVDSALKNKYKLILVKSAEKALQYLTKNLVDLILMDIMMPEMDGFEAFERIKEMNLEREIPLVFFTSDIDSEIEIKGLEMGAVDFIRKPFVPKVMLNRINRILEFEDLKQNLENKVKEKAMRVEQLSFEIISTIASMIEAKDSYTKGHSVRVAEYSALVARKIGWKDEDAQNLKYVALLHDIGKVGIPDNVLNKPGRLTDAEFNIIKSHTTIGGDILKDIITIPNVDAGAKYHHERYDGKGYPCGLSGDSIPDVARIICIADSYDAMRSKRIYRESLPLDVIRNELVNGRGKQFDPEYLDVFLGLFDEGALEIDFDETGKEITISSEGSVLINQIMKCIEEEAKKTESVDYLTGLLGRKEGENQIAQAIRQKKGCLAFVDLDNLKRTNDTMGHLAGDFALKTVGDVLNEYSDNAIVLRLGGDEFIYYMTDVDRFEAKMRVETLIDSFERKKKKSAFLSVSSLSIGLCMTDVTDKYANVLKKADRALYHVKQSGKCGYYFYNNIEQEKSNKSIDLERLVLSLSNQGNYSGPLSVEYREFAKIYEFFQHLGERYKYNVHLMMITLEFAYQNNFYIDEREHAMTCMEKTIQVSLRAVDVCTRFSSEQFIVVLMNAQEDAVEIIKRRILENFYKIYDKNLINVNFDIALLTDQQEQ